MTVAAATAALPGALSEGAAADASPVAKATAVEARRAVRGEPHPKPIDSETTSDAVDLQTAVLVSKLSSTGTSNSSGRYPRIPACNFQ